MKLVHLPTLFLIPLLPLLGAAWCGLVGARAQRRFGERAVHRPAVLLPWISFAFAAHAVAVLAVSGPDAVLAQRLWAWLPVGDLDADLAFQLDRLSAVMCLVVTFVGSLIHVYSIGYMHGDPGYWRFFCYLNLFLFAMLVLVLADNLLLMFVGWEGVGLCSYLLIGFWYRDREKAIAGIKAFVVNRVGDAGFALGLFLLFWGLAGTGRPVGGPPDVLESPLAGRSTAVETEEPRREAGRAASPIARPGGTAEEPHRSAEATDASPLPRTSIRFREVERILRDPARRHAFASQRWLGLSVLTLSCLLLFFGATGKSAQIPLYTWLPDAMAGPTPVSALIHAATMVTAGVYLVARLHFLFALSPTAMTVVATVGTATALFAATIGLFQYDIKKVLAYSTVSQLGFMFVAVGVGAWWVGIFHLVTHAFFKACLFLGSGSVILGCHHEQDMRRMGGLRRWMPVTAITYFLSCCAIAGFPFFSGFFSKDEILWNVFATANLRYASGGVVLWAVAAGAALCTSFYMFRSYYMTFTGDYRGATGGEVHGPEHGHGALPKESPPSITGVLVVLAALAVVGGVVGLPHLWHLPNALESWLEPVFAGSEHLVRRRDFGPAVEWGLMGLSVAIALGGFALARWLYLAARNPIPARLLESPNPVVRFVHRLIYRKYYVDEVYGRVFVDGALGASRSLASFDARVIDGLVNLCGRAGRICGDLQGWIDRRFVDGLVNRVGDAIVAGGRNLRLVQSGRIQSYVAGLVAGAIALVAITYVVPW